MAASESFDFAKATPQTVHHGVTWNTSIYDMYMIQILQTSEMDTLQKQNCKVIFKLTFFPMK